MIALARHIAVHRQQERAGRVLTWGELIHFLDHHGRFPVSPVERGEMLRNMHADLAEFRVFRHDRPGNTFEVMRDAPQTDANILVDAVVANAEDATAKALAVRREIVYVSVPVVRMGFEIDCETLLGDTAGLLPTSPITNGTELARRLVDPSLNASSSESASWEVILCHDELLCITVRLCTPWMQSEENAPKPWRRGALVRGRVDPTTPNITAVADRGVELMFDIRRFSHRMIPLVSPSLRDRASALAAHLVTQFSP